MSRVGKKPIPVPSAVKVQIGESLRVQGPKGTLEVPIPAGIRIQQADGKLAVFEVSSVRLYRKSQFPTATVYGPAPTPELRLITCGGTFDPQLGSYLSNVVVYSVLAS